MKRVADILAPLNTRATSAAGAAAATGLSARLYHDLTDWHFVRSWYQAIVLHADPWPLYELTSIACGFLLCAIALYIGAPWFVRGDATPQPAAVRGKENP